MAPFSPAPTPELSASLTVPPHSPAAFSSDYSFCGKIIRILLANDLLVDEIAPRLEPFLTTPSSPPDLTFQVAVSDGVYYLFSNSVFIAKEAHLGEFRIRLLQEFVRHSSPQKDWLAIFHAAACGTVERCVLLPALSHSGKTTLAAALMHSGLLLYTEDSAFLEAKELKVPRTPFALMVREGSWPALLPRFPELEHARIISHTGINVRFLAPHDLNEMQSAPVSAIVFSRWEPDATTRIQPLETLETLIRLKESGFWVAHDCHSIQVFLDWLESLPSYEMIYSDLDEATAFIRKLVA